MKIGIVGTKKVGKTTLANLLTGHLKSLGYSCDLVPEVARRCPFSLNEKTSLDAAFWLFGAQIADEALVEQTRETVICDRTIIDPLAFLLAQVRLQENELAALLQFVRAYLKARPYDYFIYLPITDKRFQETTAQDTFRELVAGEFRRIFKELDVKCVELQATEDYARLKEILMLIQR